MLFFDWTGKRVSERAFLQLASKNAPIAWHCVPLAVFSIILFLSGCSALIFQTLWLRLSGLAFGNSVWAAALILSSFMAGLAIGSAIAASIKVSRIRPLWLYAVLELVVAVLGFALVCGLPSLAAALRPLFQRLWFDQPLLIVLRFALSFLILLLPTTAMGLTLPVLAHDPLLARSSFARSIGLLYGWNTLGAVVGALAGEVCLIGWYGLTRTALIAAALNITVSLIALALSKACSSEWLIQDSPPSKSIRPPLPLRLLLVGFGAGSTLLCLEVVWFRFLRLYIASSSLAFAIMLAVVLVGIGLGGVAYGALPASVTQSDPFGPILCLAAAVAALVSYIFFPTSLRTDAGPFYLDQWRQISLLALALMLPVALFSGMLFPAIVTRVQKAIDNRMSSVGLVTLANTIGATCGPLLASFLMLPRLGFQWTLILCAVCYGGLAVILIAQAGWRLNSIGGISVLGVAAALVVILVVFPYHRDETHFAHARMPYVEDGARLVKKIEGTADTMQLLQSNYLGQPYYNQLLVNAFTMSSTSLRNQRYMRLFAYLPLTMRPQSEDALLICYGCGITAHALTTDSHLKRIDIVDISKEVFSLTPLYSTPGVSNPLLDSRVTPIVQDGRFYLEATTRRYDVITGEPPPPKVAGSVNLYTEEFFRIMRDDLKEGGVASFWLPMYQLTVEETKAILHAFHNAFPNSSVWGSIDQEWIMVGIRGSSSRITHEELGRLWQEKAAGENLKRIGLEIPEQLESLFVMDANEIERVSRDTPPLTDQYPKRLTDIHPDEQAARKFAWNYLEARAALQNFSSSSVSTKIWPYTSKRVLEQLFILREARFLSGAIGSNKLAELDLYLRHSKLRVPVLEVLNSNEIKLAIAEEVAPNPETGLVEALPDLVAGALARRDYSAAIHLLEIQKSRGGIGANDLFLLTYLYCLNNEVEKAQTLAAYISSSVPEDWFMRWLWDKLQSDFGFQPPQG